MPCLPSTTSNKFLSQDNVMTKRAIIIGGSLGGLFTGLLLRRLGWDVTIHERSGEELGSRGAGIVTHDSLHDILSLAVGYRENIGVPLTGRTVLDANGVTVCENQREQVVASWDQLWKRLRKAAEPIYRHDSTLQSFTQFTGGVDAEFANAQQERCDLLIAADGIQSTIRRNLLPEIKPLYAGYIAWRGLVDQADLSPQTISQLFNRFSFCLPPSEQMLGYPVDGGAGGQLRYNYVWYRPAHVENELPRLLTGHDGKSYVGGIPPDQIHPDVLAEMRVAATNLLAPAFAEAVHKTQQPLLQPIVDLEIPRMSVGRIVLLGDAAFVARPHVGMGVTKAAEDALALATCLENDGDVDSALAAFSKNRVTAGQRIIRRARHLGAYMQAQLLSDEEREKAHAHRSPQAVMNETASTHGMQAW
jgi:2-polyprenyl-6-methoxyphenol hydroxylase-like FAD-dependent oxidoreductase